MARWLLLFCALLLVGCPEDTDVSLSFDPDPLSFGVVAVGGSETLTIVVENRGDDLILERIALVGDDAFEIGAVDVPTTIVAGGELRLEVTFTPEEVGDFAAVLEVAADVGPTVVSNDSTVGVWEIAVTGTGVTIPPAEDDDGDGYPSIAGGGTDCDDTDASIHPGATELCNGIDDDCDDDVDEDLEEWESFPDADGDGYGDADGVAVLGCSTPDGHVDNLGDCDDTDPDRNPDADEVCDEVDNDCDGDSDEGLATTDWYPDLDDDGFGDDAAAPLNACAEPPDSSADATDCDDDEASTYPAAVEACDAVDSDCDDSLVDEEVDTDGDLNPDCTDDDDDGDASLDADDCDDLDLSIYPGAPETIDDGIDQDCDGFDTVSCFVDADDDGWGSGPTTSADGDCDDLGESAVDGDCDDGDDAISPDAIEIHDGVDNDCDGSIDDGLHVGNGSDGPLTVTETTDLSATGLAPSWPVLAIAAGPTVTVTDAVVGLAAGDEVLIANLHGSDAAHAAAGTYEFATVASVSGTDIVLAGPLAEIFGEVDNTDLVDQAVLVQRVPQFTDVTVGPDGLLTTTPWDGALGGVLALRATGTVLVEDGGAISTDSLGYWGGEGGSASNCDSFQGESYAGTGDGDVCVTYNEALGYWAANYGGGGAHVTGGGGAYGPGATPGDSWTGGGATPPEAGIEYGDVYLSTLFFGSGGGGVWDGTGFQPDGDPGPGGDGGGILVLGAAAVQVDGPGGLSAVGGTTFFWSWGAWAYGAGGGAGGAVYVQADAVTLAEDAIDAAGGLGQDDYLRVGGDGGVGRVRVDFGTANGFDYGTEEADAAVNDGTEPNPGFSGPL